MATVVCNTLSAEAATSDAVVTAEHRAAHPGLEPPVCPIPQLGFCGYVVSGTGEYVLSVKRGTTAARMGLEAGDVILALNDHRLTCEGAWYRGMAQAAAGDGKVTLRIRRGRTGGIADRTCHVFWPPRVR